MITLQTLNQTLGNIDIYLLDHLLKGRFVDVKKILDVGCGEGRNLVYFLQAGYEVYGIDKNEDAIRMVRVLASSLQKDYPADRFVAGLIEALPYNDAAFDLVISSAVLHFSESEEHFEQLFREQLRVLIPGGVLFIRMASNVGFDKLQTLGQGRYRLPDGSIRYLITPRKWETLQKEYNLTIVEPVKTVVVDGRRAMTTIVWRRG